MKPLDQCTPEEVAERALVALNEASVHDLIDALAAVQGCEELMEEASRRKLIRLLVVRLAVRTMSPEYVKE